MDQQQRHQQHHEQKQQRRRDAKEPRKNRRAKHPLAHWHPKRPPPGIIIVLTNFNEVVPNGDNHPLCARQGLVRLEIKGFAVGGNKFIKQNNGLDSRVETNILLSSSCNGTFVRSLYANEKRKERRREGTVPLDKWSEWLLMGVVYVLRNE